MSHRDSNWALVLAAGDGRRLRDFTTGTSGVPVPKQFCSLTRGPSLLQEALHRARAVAGRERIATVVATDHRHWWRDQLAQLPAANVIAQPRNRGTAVGILLPLLRILERDPDARLALLPSDHYVRDEAALAEALRRAMSPRWSGGAGTVLLGLAPREPDPELGYIVPGRATGTGHFAVERFVEKPRGEIAGTLIEEGALWNAFIVAAEGRGLLKLFERRCPEVIAAMREALAHTDPDERTRALADLYPELPVLDFSRDVLQGQEQHLRVMPVEDCGWSDLGTPARVADVLRRGPLDPDAVAEEPDEPVLLSLADSYRRLSGRLGARHAPASAEGCTPG